jgi:hypothetical protein
MRNTAVAFAVLTLMASAAMAQDLPSSKKQTPPDYSPPRLLQLFHDIDVTADNPVRSPFETGIVFEQGPFRYRWVPLLAPMQLQASNSQLARVSPMAALTVVPFALNHVSLPYTPESYRDPISERRFEQMLRRNEEEAKKERGEQ